jgi:hypothetical protein
MDPREMILSINRPYFAPYPGFFYKAYLTDVLVILDSVQFPLGTTWISRNRFKNSEGTLWMTIPVWKKGLGLQRINKVRICYDGRWTRKHLESLKVAYDKAPYFADHLGFVAGLFSARFDNLIDLNLEIIRYLLHQFDIRTDIVLLSELAIETTGDRLLVDICRKLGGSRFLVQDSARKHLVPQLFRENGIALEYFRDSTPVYPQLWGDFIADLSTFDLVFNCGPKARDIMMRR